RFPPASPAALPAPPSPPPTDHVGRPQSAPPPAGQPPRRKKEKHGHSGRPPGGRPAEIADEGHRHRTHQPRRQNSKQQDPRNSAENVDGIGGKGEQGDLHLLSDPLGVADDKGQRSEEHTSELQ